VGADEMKVSTDLNPIHLSIFANRFMSIAEQMGSTLRRTAISTNIKVLIYCLFIFFYSLFGGGCCIEKNQLSHRKDLTFHVLSSLPMVGL
jgi:hypothetical protein